MQEQLCQKNKCGHEFLCGAVVIQRLMIMMILSRIGGGMEGG